MNFLSSNIFTQTFQLWKKTIILYFRRFFVTGCQILTPCMVVLWLLGLTLLMRIGDGNKSYIETNTWDITNSMVRCTAGSKDEKCYTLAFVRNGYKLTDDIVGVVSKRFNLTVGDDKDIKIFDKDKEMEDWILKNPNRTQTVVSFETPTQSSQTSYVLRYNVTGTRGKRVVVHDLPPQHNSVQIALDEAIYQVIVNYKKIATSTVLGLANVTKIDDWISVKGKGFPYIATRSDPSVEILNEVGATFFSLGTMTLLVMSAYLLVDEKEKKLRLSLTLVGMRLAPHWISWGLIFMKLALFSTLSTMAMSAACQFFPFLYTNQFCIFLLFLSFNIALISLAFLLSTITNSGRTSLILGFILMATAGILNLIVSNGTIVYFLFESKTWWVKLIVVLLYFYPPFQFSKAFSDFVYFTKPIFDPSTGKYTKNVGYSFAQFFKPMKINIGFEMTAPATVWSVVILLGSSVVYIIIGIYFDYILPQESGVTGHPLFFLTPNWWKGIISMFSRSNPSTGNDNPNPPSPHRLSQMDPDVRAEHHEAVNNVDAVVRIINFEKEYTKKALGIVPIGKVHAVKGISLSLKKGTCLCILGQNGCGKSTTINSILGVISVSQGRILINGLDPTVSIRSIRRMVGYCPQHDLLFEQLTAWQNLDLFCEFKGISWSQRKQEITKRLKQVKMYEKRNLQVGKMSGGMKRKISVCAACLGNPKLVILDEPTCGIDVRAARDIWALILSMKTEDASVILTSHSMKESEILADRICIMSHGNLECIGSSLHLKNRFGTGYNLGIVAFAGKDRKVEDLVKSFFTNDQGETSGLKLVSSTGGSFVFGIEDKSMFLNLGNLLAKLQKMSTLPESDPERIFKEYSLSATTLETVYLNITGSSTENAFEIEPDVGNNTRTENSPLLDPLLQDTV